MELVSEYNERLLKAKRILVLILVLVELVSEIVPETSNERKSNGLNPCFSGIGFGVKPKIKETVIRRLS